ncbi:MULTISPECIES: radical SAM protein [unclassified Paenibacillus]|uniref:PapB family radical SAM/SPASM ranthipeptide maturase n=1 Tax=unclassified Paenibacillus TaxID=185978 RepID=UPI0003E290B2|nr:MULTISPECIES: radical SAM protein [unclassified Paenibacillus]ETT44446.1 arylsulfatase regulator [Paenibacillus sp. FSL R7-269]OMF84337.1 radical SAM/SPASM domain-containing protein [Paenibacillus sp. FSL R7-0337]
MFNSPIKIKAVKFFEEQDNLYLYNVENSGIFQVDDTIVDICNSDGKTIEELYQLLKNNYTMEELSELLTTLEKAGVLLVQDLVDDINTDSCACTKETNGVSSLILMLVQECNLRCSYCYGVNGEYNDRGRMDMDTATQAIDFLFNQALEEELSICFFGGEPLLNYKLIQDIIPYVQSKEKLTGKRVRYSMTTNGTLLTKDVVDYLMEHQVAIQVSLDGDQKTHDFNRYFQNKEGSYDLILNRTEKLRKNGMISARATVSPVQLDITYTLKHLNEIGFRNVAMYPAVQMLDVKDYEDYSLEFTKLVNYFETLIHSKEYKKAREISNIYKYLRRVHSSSKRHYYCGAASHMLAVDVHGDLYPCQRFVSEKNYSLGNVNEGVSRLREKEILNEFSLEERTKCRECWAINLCGGDCPHENLKNTGAIEDPLEISCEFTRSAINDCIRLYLRLDEEDKDKLFNNKMIKEEEMIVS